MSVHNGEGDLLRELIKAAIERSNFSMAKLQKKAEAEAKAAALINFPSSPRRTELILHDVDHKRFSAQRLPAREHFQHCNTKCKIEEDIANMWESVKSVISIPSCLKFEEYAMVDDQLQVTYLMSDSEITNSIVKTNDDADNSSENNSDGEEIEESLVSINEAYNSVQTLRKFFSS
ncbi:Tigger transposable element-derived protein 6 [Trichinella zimbabwensis]|uniref:Tigger transposable element-derived protein 6 n=1 Tax=Trichinella zimbabwensis TaxID=268475 RepID=A0A0V1H373_9BILA|nr:Tigger transposable element-derived protein 6 [Trichinella zimbabwensis]